jgi:hypothetical protein
MLGMSGCSMPSCLAGTLFSTSPDTSCCLQTFAQIEEEKKGYLWQVKKEDKDPLGLLKEQKALHW